MEPNVCTLTATNVKEGWNGAYLLTDETTEHDHPVYKMENEQKYLYFNNQGFYIFDSDLDPTAYAAMVQTGTIDGFPASDVWFVAAGGNGYDQFAEGKIEYSCPGNIFVQYDVLYLYFNVCVIHSFQKLNFQKSASKFSLMSK